MSLFFIVYGWILSGILVIKNNKIFVTGWMDIEGIMLSEISQSKKDKYRMIALICGVERVK